MSLLVTIFLLVFLSSAIEWIGKSVLLDLCYVVYKRVFDSTAATRQRTLKQDILKKRAELAQTSAQDEFAKWAKMRRALDKAVADLEKLNQELTVKKSSFGLKFNSLLWLLTTGVQFVITWWYRKSAVFYLPPNFFGPLTWMAALPFAPKGSVSVGVWQMACRRVIKTGERLVIHAYTVYQQRNAPAPVPVQATAGKKSQ